MSKSGSRPNNEHLGRDGFVKAATGGGFSEADAVRIWRRVVEVAKGARYNASNASTEFVTRGQLKSIMDGSRLPRMSDPDWKLVQGAAAALTKGL